MKTITIPKENLNPLSSNHQYGLRNSIPLRITSALKSSNVIPAPQTLAELTARYESDKNNLKRKSINAPLIQVGVNDQNCSLFTKKTKKPLVVAPNFVKQKSLIAKQSQLNQTTLEKQFSQQEKLDQKLQQLIKMIDEDQKQQLKRCHSNIPRNLRPYTSQVGRKPISIQEQIPLPSPMDNVKTSQDDSTLTIRVKTPSFLTKFGDKSRCSLLTEQPTRKQMVKSSYFQTQSNLRTNAQRMSHYQANSKVQKPQSSPLRLCINCLSYVNSKQISEHQQKCLGFHIILKMSNAELVDFLNEKLSDKLKELNQVQLQINSLNKSSSQINASQMVSLIQKKSKTDQIINDLDGIRLKALKRFYTKHLPTKKQRK